VDTNYALGVAVLVGAVESLFLKYLKEGRLQESLSLAVQIRGLCDWVIECSIPNSLDMH
jgi:hypothetical protein